MGETTDRPGDDFARATAGTDLPAGFTLDVRALGVDVDAVHARVMAYARARDTVFARLGPVLAPEALTTLDRHLRRLPAAGAVRLMVALETAYAAGYYPTPGAGRPAGGRRTRGWHGNRLPRGHPARGGRGDLRRPLVARGVVVLMTVPRPRSPPCRPRPTIRPPLISYREVRCPNAGRRSAGRRFRCGCDLGARRSWCGDFG